MKQVMLRVAVASLLVTAPSCGSVYSRAGQIKFGAYPFEAVGIDFRLMAAVGAGRVEMMGLQAHGIGLFFGGLLSLPFDLALDAVFLPFDLLGWVIGDYKGADSQPNTAQQPTSAPGGARG